MILKIRDSGKVSLFEFLLLYVLSIIWSWDDFYRINSTKKFSKLKSYIGKYLHLKVYSFSSAVTDNCQFQEIYFQNFCKEIAISWKM